MQVLRIDSLPQEPSAAAARFYAVFQPKAMALLQEGAGGLILELPAADHAHSDWRRAAVRDLARLAAPKRVVMIAGGDGHAREQAAAYIQRAPGVTGQLLDLEQQ
ncbi:MAG: Rossmann fold domain-containing protein [Alteripontixanthobacter sp.]